MANKKVTLKDRLGNILYPLTIFERVKDASGIFLSEVINNLQTAIDGKLGKTEKAASAAISDTVVDGSITTSKIADHAITAPKLSSDLTLPGTPQIGTPGALNSPSQTIATIGNLNEAMNAQQIGGTNIYRDTLGTSDFYLSATGEMKYRRFLDITPEAKRNLRGQSITVSFDYILENAVVGRGDTGFGFFVKYTDGTTTYVNAFIPAETSPVTKSGRFLYTVKIEDKEIDNITSFQPFMYAQTTSGTATVGRPKFETGTKATQWSPAPEEMKAYSDNVLTSVEQLTDQLTTDVNNTLGTYFDSVVEPNVEEMIDDAIGRISGQNPATTTAPGTVRLATQQEVDTGEVTENIPSGSNPDEPPAVAITPMDLQRKLGSYASKTDLNSKANITSLPKVFYQSTAPTSFKDGDIWIKP